MPIRRAVLVDDDHAVARGLEEAHDLRVAAEHPLVLDGRHERRVHVDQRRAEAPGHLDQHALVGGHRAAGDEQPGEVLVAQAVVVAEAAGAEHDAAARADAPVVGGGDADDLAGLVGQHALDGMARADVDAALTGRGLHAPGELDPVARLPVGQLRDDDTAEGHLVDLVVAVVVGVVVGVHDRQGADVDQRLHRGRAVVDERRQQLVLPGRKAERRVLRVVHRRPREPRQVGHRVLARVGDALLLHEVVVGDPGPCGSLAPCPADLVGGLEQDGRRAELRGVHRRAEPGHGRAHHDDVGLPVPLRAHRCSPLANTVADARPTPCGGLDAERTTIAMLRPVARRLV